MEYPVVLKKDEERIECGEACDKIESFLSSRGESLTAEAFINFMKGMSYSSKDIECATLQEVYKELARIGFCLNINLEGENRYDISKQMMSNMWIIMHVKLMTEYIRSIGESDQ